MTGDPTWLEGTRTKAGDVAFRVEAGRTYLAVSSAARPEILSVAPSGLKDTRHGADYVVLAPRALLDAAAPLIELRRRQGLHAIGVALEDVFSEFGYGEDRPEAIRDFLRYAYHVWRAPSLRYVLLLGDGTYDFKSYLGTGAPNLVPPLQVKTSDLG